MKRRYVLFALPHVLSGTFLNKNLFPLVPEVWFLRRAFYFGSFGYVVLKSSSECTNYHEKQCWKYLLDLELDWSALMEIVWISRIAIVQAAPCPWLENLKEGQCFITAVYSHLHCKHSWFQPASTSPEAQRTHSLHSKVGLHAVSHLQPYKERPRKLQGALLCRGTFGALSVMN